MKGAGLLDASLRGVKFGYWSHLGCSGQNAIIFSCKRLFTHEKNIKKVIYFQIVLIYSIHVIKV